MATHPGKAWIVALGSGYFDPDDLAETEWFFGPCSLRTAERTVKEINEMAGETAAEVVPLRAISKIWVVARAAREINPSSSAK